MADRGTATATIVFTDVVGSTQVRSQLGEIEADQLFREHERTLAEVVAAHQGRVKAAGDGIMATFDAASTRWRRRCRCSGGSPDRPCAPAPRPTSSSASGSPPAT